MVSRGVKVSSLTAAALAVALAGCGASPSGDDDDALDANLGGDGSVPSIDGTPAFDAPSPDARKIYDATPPSDATVEASTFDSLFRAFRLSLGMDLVPSDDNIRQSAQNHCFYCDNNPADCGPRENNPGAVGYTGENFWNRMAAAGFSGDAFTEVMSLFGDPSTAFPSWVATVYHRIPLVSYQSSAYGYGAGMFCDTGDFAREDPADPDQRAHWPLADATEIPLAAATEFPEVGTPPNGYPISLHGSSALTISSHALVVGGAGTPVPYLLLDEASDPNGHVTALQVYLVPEDPLSAGTTYRATISGTQNGSAFTTTWTFTTVI